MTAPVKKFLEKKSLSQNFMFHPKHQLDGTA
jgi:hypothetical protein